MGFSQALSGLNAAARNIDVVGNNIANSQTYGFKGSSVQFADVYAGSKIGQGVRVAGVLQDFSSGTLQSTGRAMDLAVNGNGFFRFKQGDHIVFSRNGQLTMTKDGYLENASGAKLTGFPAGVGVGGTPQPIQVPSAAMAANATSKVNATFNLDATMGTINRGTTPFDANDPGTYSYANTGTTYDSLGVPHLMTTYFTKTGANTWETRVAIDGSQAGTGQLKFDTNGVLDTAGSTFPAVTYNPGGGAATMNFTLDLDGTTQFGNDFSLSSLTQNGYTSGQLVGIHFGEDGSVVGSYSNQQSRSLGTIALANFRDKAGLEPVGNNAWKETGASGQPLLGTAGTGKFGTLEGSALEASNVDLASQLVNLIIAQRTYQANAQTVKVQDHILQSTVNLA
ncbi:MAG TPA: flagellar hook protein FlgE [Oleiagrimonas sp.]|nr:flagellar hook protein FlgE [Oleiagrimonas sp.]